MPVNQLDEVLSLNFPEQYLNIKNELIAIATYLDKCTYYIEIYDQNIPLKLQENFKQLHAEFGSTISRLPLHNLSDLNSWTNAVNPVAKLISDFYNINNGSHTIATGGYYLCNALLNLVESSNNKSSSLDSLTQQANDILSKHTALLDTLQKKGEEEVTKNYAKMFSDDANELKENSRLWLFCIIAATVAFILFIIFEDKIVPLEPSNNTTIITLSYLRRLLIISFFIFVITFIVKQYNVKMHLYTQNKHRSNTLSSYKLFIQSMGDNDSEARSQLMREVSKSIYESGNTGYLSVKDDGESSSNTIINEITKIIKPGSDK